jgi:hypothetical protein
MSIVVMTFTLDHGNKCIGFFGPAGRVQLTISEKSLSLQVKQLTDMLFTQNPNSAP